MLPTVYKKYIKSISKRICKLNTHYFDYCDFLLDFAPDVDDSILDFAQHDNFDDHLGNYPKNQKQN